MNHNSTKEEKDAIIDKLRKENRKLRQTRVTQITKQVEVVPPDYKELKWTCRKQEERIHNLQRIIEAGNISTLETQIDEYTNYSRSRLKSIAHEAAMTSFSEAEARKVLSFVEYLNYVSSEIYGLISVYEGGRRMATPALRVCATKLDQLLEFIGQKSFLATLDEKKLHLFLHAIDTFQSEIQACMKQQEEK